MRRLTVSNVHRYTLRSTRWRIYARADALEQLDLSFLGSMLSIKPLIEVRNGVVEPAGKQRTRSKALNSIVAVVKEHVEQIEQLCVLHAACEDVDAFVEQTNAVVNVDVLVGQVGPVVGAHAGLGTIGVASDNPLITPPKQWSTIIRDTGLMNAFVPALLSPGQDSIAHWIVL